MKFYKSIRFRIVAGSVLFCALLIFLNTATIFFVMGRGMSKMIDTLVSTEVDYFLYRYEKDKTTPLPHSKYIHVYKTFDELRDSVKEVVKDLGPGVHSVRKFKKGRPLHLAVIQLPDKKKPYYMIFHSRGFFDKNVFLTPMEILFTLLGLLVVPCGIAGYFLARGIFKPVVKLVNQIRNLDPENLQTRFSQNQPGNEIGMLSQTIDDTMNRINAFIQREKQFTRDASHELRTPLTIVSGAVEIMEQQPEVGQNPMLAKPLKRISDSAKNMQTTIETFLWLAREESGPAESCRVAPVVQKAADDTRYLIEQKNVSLTIDIRHDKWVTVKEEILYIVVVNLVRNAFQFTASGSVDLILDEEKFSVEDTGKGIDPKVLEQVTQPHVKTEASCGFGLGLSIVSRLSQRFGWKFEIDNATEKGTRVTVYWKEKI